MFIEVGRLKFELFHDQLPFTSENFRCKVLSVSIDSGHPQQTGYGTPQYTQIVTVSLQHSVHTCACISQGMHTHTHVLRIVVSWFDALKAFVRVRPAWVIGYVRAGAGSKQRWSRHLKSLECPVFATSLMFSVYSVRPRFVGRVPRGMVPLEPWTVQSEGQRFNWTCQPWRFDPSGSLFSSTFHCQEAIAEV